MYPSPPMMRTEGFSAMVVLWRDARWEGCNKLRSGVVERGRGWASKPGRIRCFDGCSFVYVWMFSSNRECVVVLPFSAPFIFLSLFPSFFSFFVLAASR